MNRRLSALVLTVAAVVAAVAALPALSGANGITWEPMIASQRFEWQQPLPQGNPIDAVDFVSPTLGWAVGDNGTVLKTTIELLELHQVQPEDPAPLRGHLAPAGLPSDRQRPRFGVVEQLRVRESEVVPARA